MIEKNTDLVYFTRLHWIIFLWPVLFLAAAIGVDIFVAQLHPFFLIFELLALFWIIITWATFYFSSITINRKGIILRTGFLVRQTVDMPLSKVETIDIRQSILGSVFHYGALVITGTGGTRHLINYLNKPLTCRRHIEQLMNGPPQ